MSGGSVFVISCMRRRISSAIATVLRVGLLRIAIRPTVGIAVEARVLANVFGAVLDARDVAESNRRAVRRTTITMLVSASTERNSASVFTWNSMRSPLHDAAGALDVLAPQRADHVGRREPARAQRFAVEPDADVAVARAEHRDAGDALDRLELRLDVILARTRVASTAGRSVMIGIHITGKSLESILLTIGRLELLRQIPTRARPTLSRTSCAATSRSAPSSNSTEIEEKPWRERDVRRFTPAIVLSCSSSDVGDVLLHHLGARALEVGGDGHHREFHLRVLIDAEPDVAEHAEHDQRERSSST